MKESSFQHGLISRLRNLGLTVIKTDPTYIQGFPDLLILSGSKWAMLECKRSARSPHQPNQDYYVEKFNQESFARFIFPENVDEVLSDLVDFFSLD